MRRKEKAGGRQKIEGLKLALVRGENCFDHFKFDLR